MRDIICRLDECQLLKKVTIFQHRKEILNVLCECNLFYNFSLQNFTPSAMV